MATATTKLAKLRDPDTHTSLVSLILTKLTSLFVSRFSVDNDLKYVPEAQELIRPERNTLTVSFEDVEKYNQQLATTVMEEYYR
jgi:hypothetical protein